MVCSLTIDSQGGGDAFIRRFLNDVEDGVDPQENVVIVCVQDQAYVLENAAKLRYLSGFFRLEFERQENLNLNDTTVYLDQEQFDKFAILSRWIFEGVNISRILATPFTYENAVEIYLLAIEFDVPLLKNQVLDVMVAQRAVTDLRAPFDGRLLPSPAAYDLAYRPQTFGTGLRRLMVDFAIQVWSLRRLSELENREQPIQVDIDPFWGLGRGGLNMEFKAEFADAMWALRGMEAHLLRPWLRYWDQLNVSCNYHEHHENGQA